MKLENPWITLQCEAQQVPANGLATFLQEQYGQLGEDLILEGLLKSAFAARGLQPQQIRYLEIGANHPIQTSNTYLFARKWGGQGVLVEANPALIDRLRAVRPNDLVLNLAVVPEADRKTVQLNVSQHSELSSVDLGHLRSFGQLGQLDRVVDVPAITLDALFEQHGGTGLHLMSIDIEGVDLDVLASSAFACRPLLVVTEPSRHYHRDAELGFLRVMLNKGYFELARTDYNLVFADAQAFSPHGGLAAKPLTATVPAREPQRSFDIFDTLIARRCIRPVAVFEEVERRCGASGFAALRQVAERAVEANEYTLADIYSALARMASLDATVAQALMAHEIAVELEMVVPMAENLALVRDDSLLITDMYLPEPTIRQLLAKVGIPAHLSLLRTSHGKRQGEVWRALAAADVHLHHLGDHAVSDVSQARAVGMQATLSTLHLPTPTEQLLLGAGCPRLAETLRALRLATPRGALSAELHRLQVELNLPVLLISALHLLAEGGPGPLLFSSRDSRYLHTVYEAAAAALPGPHPAGAYWFTSRVARTSGDLDYLDYCRQLAGEGALLVDLCGTGASVAALRARLGLPVDAMPLFVCERIESPTQTQDLTLRYGLSDAPAPPRALWTNLTLVPNEVLELLNYVPEGMVIGVRRMPGGFMPRRAALEFSATILPQVQEQARFVYAWAQALRAMPVTGLLDELRALTPSACAAVGHAAAGLVAPMQSLMAAWLPEHRAQEQTLMKARG